MIDNLPRICEELQEKDGDILLKLTSMIYEGMNDKVILQKECGVNAINKGINLGLIKYYKDNFVILSSKTKYFKLH